MTAQQAKATPNITLDLENLGEQYIGTVKPGEVLDGETRGDGMFYFKMSRKVGKKWQPVECRLPIGANGVWILEPENIITIPFPYGKPVQRKNPLD